MHEPVGDVLAVLEAGLAVRQDAFTRVPRVEVVVLGVFLGVGEHVAVHVHRLVLFKRIDHH